MEEAPANSLSFILKKAVRRAHFATLFLAFCVGVFAVVAVNTCLLPCRKVHYFFIVVKIIILAGSAYINCFLRRVFPFPGIFFF